MHFTVEFGRSCAEASKASAVVEPKHGRGGVTKKAKLGCPKPAGQSIWRAARCCQPVTVEGHMSPFVPQDEAAHRAQRRNWAVALEQAVIGRAGDFGQQQNLEFKANSERTPAKAECGKAPMGRNAPGAEPIDRATKQARMLTLLREPQANQLSHLGSGTAKSIGIACDKRCGPAAVSELEFRQRAPQWIQKCGWESPWSAPIRVGAT